MQKTTLCNTIEKSNQCSVKKNSHLMMMKIHKMRIFYKNAKIYKNISIVVPALVVVVLAIVVLNLKLKLVKVEAGADPEKININDLP